jgi:hypothetical protein
MPVGLFRFFEKLIWWSSSSIPATGTVILLHEREKVRKSFPWYDEMQSLTLAHQNLSTHHAEGTTSSSATASPMASPGLAPSSRLLRTTSRNVAGDQALVPGLGTQASLQKRFSLCEMPLVELAEQLTLIELGMFRYALQWPWNRFMRSNAHLFRFFSLSRSIREREFLNLNWKRTEHKRNARHIVKMVERFNKVSPNRSLSSPRSFLSLIRLFYLQVSYWVATRIVRETDLKRRCSLLKRFIILAEVPTISFCTRRLFG